MLGECLHAQLTLGKDGWHCVACLRMFLPSGETGAEQETVILRDRLRILTPAFDQAIAAKERLEQIIEASMMSTTNFNGDPR